MNIYNATPLKDSLLGNTNQLISQYQLLNHHVQEEDGQHYMLNGSGKVVPKTKAKPKEKSKAKPKQKLIDTFTKVDLEKIAKKHDISLKSRDGKLKTKEQLFNSLKRKKLI